MEEEKKNFFVNFWTSITDFEKYEEFAAEKTSKAIKYLVLLTLILTIVVGGMYTYKCYSLIKTVENYVNENIEEIKLGNGLLEVDTDKPIVVEDEKSIIPIIIVDTKEDINEQEYIEKMKAYNTGILFLKEKAVVVSSALAQEQEVYYSVLFDTNTEIDGKEAFLNSFNGQSMYKIYGAFIFTIIIYLFVAYLISNIIDILVLAVLGYIFARIVKIKIRYKAAFNISTHAITLPIVLNVIYIIINTFINFKIEYFQWMYTTISYIYVAVAILMIKTEIIHQRIQLIKLREIQKQVAEEAKEVEPEKQEREEKKQKEDKKEKKENTGEEPEGSKA
ncbi:MAG: DUF1189 domain-containing protein [Clostridia bacterium]|nr:DUF1189 domain-containing protein [Clostridia bacterium]